MDRIDKSEADAQRDESSSRQSGPAVSADRQPSKDNGNGAKRRPDNRHRARNRRPHGNAYAALDLGTNNCRILVARPQQRGFKVVDAFSRIVRLGEGVSQTGHISEAAIKRTVDALKVCARKLKYNNVKRARLVATEACRVAKNGDDFLERVERDTGLSLEIINPETEARLAVSGSASLIGSRCEGCLVFDIGGGSTELIWLEMDGSQTVDPIAAQNFIKEWASIPIGVVNLAETFGGINVTPELFEAMVKETENHLTRFPAKEKIQQALADKKRIHLLGTSGTVTTLAGIGLGLNRYVRDRVDGVWFEREAMIKVSQQLLGSSYEERLANGCIGQERADLVLPGCAILEAICRAWPARSLRVADRGLREGMLTMMMAEDRVWDGKQSRPHHRRKRKRDHNGAKDGHSGNAPAGNGPQ